jgi:endonuclease/exonuclease/phosphatase family metal-dependent hydrolase
LSSETLKILSYNIQVGIQTAKYSDYVKNGWQHVMPHRQRRQQLVRIASLLQSYDIVALQEADGGSFRSDYTNQVKFLAEMAGFDNWYAQTNRNLAGIARHSNGLLSKHPFSFLASHKLPGIIPGRGAIESVVEIGHTPISIIAAHLALSGRARKKQLAYLSDLLCEKSHFILMGDFNCGYNQVIKEFRDNHVILKHQPVLGATYPSWAPNQVFDHIFVSPSIEIKKINVVDWLGSDHLPVASELSVA